MMARWISSGLLGGIILFIWGAISWTVLPWHMMAFQSFKDQPKVLKTLKDNAPQSGVYLIMPTQPATKPQAVVFTSVYLESPVSMTMPMIISLATQIAAALLVAWLLLQTTLGYWGRVAFTLVFALAAGIVNYLPSWNWFGFSSMFTGIAMLDLLIGWFFAGLVLAKITNNK